MEWIDSLSGILANPWVGRGLALIFLALSVIFKMEVTKYKNLLKEIRDLATAYTDAKKPSSNGGEKITDEEGQVIEKEAGEVIGAIAALFDKSDG